MTDTIPSMTTTQAMVPDAQMSQIAQDLVDRSRSEKVNLIGPGGMLTGLTKTVLEATLNAELDDHLGYAKHQAAGRGSGNSRNGARTKTVITDVGPVELDVPRDRAGSFNPVIVPKRARRLTGTDDLVLSLTARGLTTGEICAHLAEVYGTSLSKDTISRITDRVLEEMTDWCTRPLEAVYPVVFIDAIVVKVRDGQVTNKPFYVAIGVTLAGERDILGIYAGGDGGEGAKYWLNVLTQLKNRGVADVCIVCCDGLKGLPEAISATWPLAQVQTCIVHLMRNTFKYASRKDWAAISRDLKPVYTAPDAAAAEARLGDFAEAWESKYPAAVRLWYDAWERFIPFLDYDAEIRTVICTTNAIESLNARYRRAIRARGHFPTDQAALKCLYLVTRSLDPTGKGRARWITRWKAPLNAFAITFGERLNPIH